MIMGDSTQRSLFEALEGLLVALGFTCTHHGPVLQGHTLYAEDDHQKDYDADCRREPRRAHLLSFRFLRGLDHLKLRLNVANWSRKLLCTAPHTPRRACILYQRRAPAC